MNHGRGTGPNQSGQMLATATMEEPPILLGGAPRVGPGGGGVERAWHSPDSKAGRQLVAVGNSYSIKNTEIFQNLATQVAVLINVSCIFKSF